MALAVGLGNLHKHPKSPADPDQGSKTRRNQLLIRWAHLQCSYTLGEIAAHLDIHYTTVSKVVNENSEN